MQIFPKEWQKKGSCAKATSRKRQTARQSDKGTGDGDKFMALLSLVLANGYDGEQRQSSLKASNA